MIQAQVVLGALEVLLDQCQRQLRLGAKLDLGRHNTASTVGLGSGQRSPPRCGRAGRLGPFRSTLVILEGRPLVEQWARPSGVWPCVRIRMARQRVLGEPPGLIHIATTKRAETRRTNWLI